MGVLLLLILLANAMRPTMWRTTWRMLLSPMERKYEDENTSAVWTGLSYIFSIGTYALLLVYLVGTREVGFSALHYSSFQWVALTILGVDLLRQGFMVLLQYTFRFHIHFPSVIKHHHGLLLIFAMVCYAFLLLINHVSYSVLLTMVITACMCYVGISWWKIITTVGLDIHTSCYTILYYLHIEVVPIIAIVLISARIVEA